MTTDKARELAQQIETSVNALAAEWTIEQVFEPPLFAFSQIQ